MSHKIQVATTITEESRARLRKLAEETQQSEAALIRLAIARLLNGRPQ